MNDHQFNEMSRNYVEVGAWLSSCKNLPDELLKPHIHVLRKSINALLDNVDAVDRDLTPKA